MPRGVKATDEPQVTMSELDHPIEPAKPGFDPAKHLMKLKGKDYLEVKWRLVWFRDVNPSGSIQTELVSATDKQAIFRATVIAEDGGIATGYGSETPGDFGDFLEKAETKAIGRALGALGFGTQFSEDFDFGAEEKGKVVDSPVGRPGASSRPATATTRPAASSGGSFSAPAAPPPNDGEGWKCEQCGSSLVDTPKSTAADKAGWSMKKTGKVLCWNHQQEALGKA